jgi:fatty-acid peroxygenase
MSGAGAPGSTRAIPRLPGIDHTAAFLADPYRFFSRACARLDSDVVQVRLMLRPCIGLVGAQAAQLFYDKERFTRVGAAPEPVRATLLGKGALQSLDGDEHLVRKAFFLRATSPGRVAALVARVEQGWRAAEQDWPLDQPFSLYEAAQDVLARAVCEWAGVPLPAAEARQRTRELVALFDQAASGPAAHLRARRARRQAEHWLCVLVERSRRGEDVFPAGSVAHEAAQMRGARGALLPPRIAAVELLNVLRPTVAVSVYLVLGAHAMHRHPQWRGALTGQRPEAARAFVQEVRRCYPFFPAVAARTTRAFTWNGLRFPGGVRALLDLHGTNHHRGSWQTPEQFLPERFLQGPPGPFAFVPQGGGRAEDHHRCPGEAIVLALMETGLRLLATSDYEVPAQDLHVRMGRMPALPASGFLVVRS